VSSFAAFHFRLGNLSRELRRSTLPGQMLAVRVLAQIPEDPTWVQTWAQIREEMSLGQTPAPNLVQILAHSRLEQKSAQLLMLANLSLGQTPVLALVQMLADSRLVQTSAQLQMLAKLNLG
jgi:hypothetical protein